MTAMERAAATAPANLGDLTVLQVGGPDAKQFLQGQLSADVAQLSASRTCLASVNSPQGRVQAVTWLVQHGDAVLVVVPQEIESRLIERLRRYVLRAKVAIEPANAEWHCYGATMPSDAASAEGRSATDRTPGATVRTAGTIAVRVASGEERCLLLAPPQGAAHAAVDGRTAWQLAEIRAGHPQVYDATWENFVAQMLNLDLLGAISFAKGCYTGQEIIARAHYRGAVKRRMVRLRVAGSAPPPGARVLAGDDAAGEVVRAAADGEAAELLAVISLARLGEELRLEHGPPLERLPLPYDLAPAS